ncbi:N-acetyltransferase family protein [Micromonospora sp. NPDC004704]
MTITIREAVQADLPALLALYGELHPNDTPLPPDRAGSIWREITAQSGRTVLLAEVDGAPAGTLDCTVLPNLTRGGRPFMLVENVVVGASVRRLGVGRELLAAAVDRARLVNCYKVQLLSRLTRDEAHVFYESCGFRQIAAGFRRYLD